MKNIRGKKAKKHTQRAEQKNTCQIWSTSTGTRPSQFHTLHGFTIHFSTSSEVFRSLLLLRIWPSRRPLPALFFLHSLVHLSPPRHTLLNSSALLSWRRWCVVREKQSSLMARCAKLLKIEHTTSTNNSTNSRCNSRGDRFRFEFHSCSTGHILPFFMSANHC